MRSTTLLCVIASGLLLSGSLPAQCRKGEAQLKELRSSAAKSLKVFNNPASDIIQKRVAFRTLLASPHKKAVIVKALKDKDSVIRARAIYESHIGNKDQGYTVLKEAAKDTNETIAKLVLDCTKAIKDQKKSTEILQWIAKNSKVPKIRQEAIRIVDFPYYREVKLLRNNPTHDHEIVTLKSITLPMSGWKFRVDPLENGHHKKFFAVDFNDAKWRKLKIGAWESQGYLGYDGVAWYRIKFKVGDKIPGTEAVELHFGAVDEVTWAWLNGKYVGQHDQGPAGWNRSFDLDITKEIKYNAENTLVVRVYDSAAAGGIWKPVKINFLK